MNMTGKKSINIIDMSEMCAHFPKESKFGSEVHLMLNEYS